MDTAVAEPKKKRGRFADPTVPNPGRPYGATAKYTRVIKEAILIAAEEHGRNGKGKGKLVGFMHKVIEEDLRTFCMMMSRAMPMQLIDERQHELTKKEDTTYKSLDEVNRELASRGLTMDVMLKFSKVLDDDDVIENDDGAVPSGENGAIPG